MSFSATDVFDHVSEIHGRQEDLDPEGEGDLFERIHLAHTYEIETVAICDLEDQWSIDEGWVEKLCTQDPKTFPMIVLHSYSKGSYSIVDGSHRISALRKLGVKTVQAYVGIPE